MSDVPKQSLGIAWFQPMMKPTLEASTAQLEAAVVWAKEQGAGLLLTPELSLTGFHRGVPELCGTPELDAALKQIEGLLSGLGSGLLCGFGYPATEGGQVTNRFVLCQAQSAFVQDKIGLTPSEQKLFVPGEARGVLETRGWRLAVALCREILDLGQLLELQGEIDVLLWPSYIQWGDGASDYEEAAKAAARELGAWVIQSNWASAINDPKLRQMGRSLVVSPAGRLLHQAAFDDHSLLNLELPSGLLQAQRGV